MRFFLKALLFLALFTPSLSLYAEETQSQTPEALEQFRLDGIAYDSNDPSASIVMINGLALYPGDEYRGFKVEEITKERAILSDLSDAEAKTAYELRPGDGQANVQKAANWDPLKKLSEIKLPTGAPTVPARNMSAAPALKGASTKPVTAGEGPLGNSGLEKLLMKTPYMKAYADTKEKIEKIKADRDIRDAEINKMFGNNPEDAAAPKLNNKIE